jgi:hypothetical protein
VLNGKCLGKIKNSFLLRVPNPSAGPAREAKAGLLQLPLSVRLPSGPGFSGCPPVSDRSLCAAPPIGDFFPQIPLPASGCCIVGIPLLPLTVRSPHCCCRCRRATPPAHGASGPLAPRVAEPSLCSIAPACMLALPLHCLDAGTSRSMTTCVQHSLLASTDAATVRASSRRRLAPSRVHSPTCVCHLERACCRVTASA